MTTQLTQQLTPDQIKANIQALTKQGAPKDTIQKYVNNYKQDLNGNFVLASPEQANADANAPAPAPTSIIKSEKGFGQSIADALYAGKASKITTANVQQHSKDIQALSDKIKEMKTAGQDTSHVESTLKTLLNEDPSAYGGEIAQIIPSINKTKEQIIGEAVGTLTDVLAGGGLGATAYGAMKGASLGAQDNKTAEGIAVESIKGALIGKASDVAFKALSPYISKAVEKYGQPFLEQIESHIPEGARAGLAKLAETAQTVADKASIGTGEGGTKVLEKVSSVIDAPFQAPLDVISAGKDAVVRQFNKIIPQTAKENVAKVLKFTGKKSLSDVATGKSIDNATEALDIIRQNAPNIKITNADGVEVPFDPSKANFLELPQALKQTKDAIYQQYTDLATQAGDAGVTINKGDFNELNATLEKFKGKGYTKAFRDKATSLQNDLALFKGKATPQELQSLIEQVNIDANPLSDKAGAQVANDFSKALRDKLDNKLEASGNPAYQATRDQYSKLKSIEGDVLNRFKEAMRKAGAQPDIIDHLTSMDALYGIMSGNPAHLITGLGTKGVKAFIQKFTGSQASLRRAFDILEKEAGNVATDAGASATAEVVAPAVQAPEVPLTPPKGRADGVLAKELAKRAKNAKK